MLRLPGEPPLVIERRGHDGHSHEALAQEDTCYNKKVISFVWLAKAECDCHDALALLMRTSFL
jgi:hypothetical protein